MPLVGAATAVAIACGLTVIAAARPPAWALGVAALGAVVAYMLFSPRLEVSLLLLCLYLGLLDGYVKLATGVGELTFVRDLLLYAIAAGALIRIVVGRRSVKLPPMSVWAIAVAVIALAQVVNPETRGVEGALAGFRQQIEFVPLFFLGWAVLITKPRIVTMLWVLAAIAALNGLVSAAQFNLTPDEFAAWGPGYAERVLGTGGTTIRYFVDEIGQTRVRPFGLGSDLGAGGSFGVVAIAAAAALVATQRGGRRVGAGVLLLGTFLTLAASQSRSSIAAAAVTFLVFLWLSASSKRAGAVFLTLTVSVVCGYAGYTLLAETSGEAAFSRVTTTFSSQEGIVSGLSERSASWPAFVENLREVPLGAGLASVGPASTAVGGAVPRNAESQANFSLVETGVPGLIWFYGFLFALLWYGARVRRVRDAELRILLAAAVAPVIGIAQLALTGPVTVQPPLGPYLWIVAGLISRWLVVDRRRTAPR